MIKKILGIVSVCGLLLGLVPLKVKAAPQVFISGVADATYYNYNVNILYGTNEGRASATLNNLPFSSGSTVSSEGVYSLLVAAIADSGTTSRSLFFGIDKTPPVISIGGVSDGQVTTGSLTPTFSANEGSVSATLSGSGFLSGQTVSSPDDYQLRVEAVDKASNTTVRTLGFRIESPPSPPPPSPPEEEEEEEEEEAPAEEAPPTVLPAPSPAPAARRIALAKAPVRRLPAPAIAAEPSIDELLRMIEIDSILNVDDGSRPLDSCSPVEIKGRAESGWWVTLFIKEQDSDEVILGVVQVGNDGKWTFRRAQAFEPGIYTLLGQLETQDGKFGPKLSLRDFRVAECKKEAPAKVLDLTWLWWLLAVILLLLILLTLWWLLLKQRRKRQMGSRLGETPSSR